MAAVSAYLGNKLIDHMRGVAAYTMPSVWIGLVTTASTAAAQGTEAAYTGYARVPLATLLSAATGNPASGTNSGVITFPACTGGTSNVVGFITADSAASGAGNLLEFGTCSLAISTAITPAFAAGTFVTTLV